MRDLIDALLGLALILALCKLGYHEWRLRRLRVSLLDRRPLVGEIHARDNSSQWHRLCAATNDLLTEVRQLQQQRTGQLAQLDITLGSLQEAVLIIDEHNYILLANPALHAIFPRAKNILKQRLESVLRSAAFLNYVEAVRQGQARAQQEIEFVEGAESVWVEATGSLIAPLDNKVSPWALFVLHNISKQKLLESIRKDFVANVSHELRTPLSVIKGYVETLVDGHNDMLLVDRSRFLLTIQRHTERLNSLLDDLLTLSRLESINPGLHREPVILPEMIEGIVTDYRARPAAVNHRLSISVGPGVQSLFIDPLKISQVFENLLDNALKYTPKGSTIIVSAYLRGNEVEVSVGDNGPGIPPEDLPHIFERFYRVDKGRSRDKGGTGLGLSIVKHIVQLHGGRVWVDSTMGQGTTFLFSLPPEASN